MKNTEHFCEIRFAGLPTGSHKFTFEVKTDFFSKYPAEKEFTDANISFFVDCEKTEDMMNLRISMAGKVTTFCDRCLDPLELELTSNDNLYVSVTGLGQTVKPDENIMEIAPETDFVVLDDFLYEMAILSLPLRKVHDEESIENSACNKEMLNLLEKMTNNVSSFTFQDILPAKEE